MMPLRQPESTGHSALRKTWRWSFVPMNLDSLRFGSSASPRPGEVIPSNNVFIFNVLSPRKHGRGLHGASADSFGYLKSFELLYMCHIMKHAPDIPDDEVTPECVLKHLCIMDDVGACIGQLKELSNVSDGSDRLMMMAHDWDDKAKWVH